MRKFTKERLSTMSVFPFTALHVHSPDSLGFCQRLIRTEFRKRKSKYNVITPTAFFCLLRMSSRNLLQVFRIRFTNKSLDTIPVFTPVTFPSHHFNRNSMSVLHRSILMDIFHFHFSTHVRRCGQKGGETLVRTQFSARSSRSVCMGRVHWG